MSGAERVPGTTYAQRVRQLEEQGLTTSDAQGAADVENQAEPFAFDPEHPADNMPRGRFDAGAPAIDTPARRLGTWSQACGGTNMVRVDGVLWSWSTSPRLQKNGAAIGRVYSQARGELTRDVCAYKIDAGGRVEWLPAELRSVLPGGATAGAGGEDSLEVTV